MAVPFSNTKLRIPQGFQNLLEGLAREVLRDQPKDVCAFAAAYFESLLDYRNKTGYDAVEQGARLQDRTYNNKSFEQPGVQPGNVEQEDAALKIQTKYRQFTAKKEVQEMREDQAAVKIQAGYRGYRDRRRVKALKNDRYRAQSNSASAQEKEEEDNYVDPEKVVAATKIQSGFRGYKARKETRVKKEAALMQSLEDEARQAPVVDSSQEEVVEERSSIDLSDPEMMEAALKIQAGLTGFKFQQEFADAVASGEGENLGTSTDEALQETEQPDEQSVPDADMHKAATKIQAGFRGMQDRRRVKALKATQSTTITEQLDNEVSQSQDDAEEETGNEPIDVAATDAEQETGKEEATVAETPRDAPGEVEDAGALPDDVDAGASVDASVDADVKPVENESEAEGVKDSERTEIDFSDSTVEQVAVRMQQQTSDKTSNEEEQPSANEVGHEAVVETPRNVPDETPRDLPEETPRDHPDETPRNLPEETPRDLPEETPRDHPDETPRNLPEEIPRDLPEETPRDLPDETPRDLPEKTPREPENETLRDSVAETPRGEPEETPGEPDDETPRNFPNKTLSDLAEESSQDPTVDETPRQLSVETPRQLSDETSKDDDSEEK